MTFKKPSRAQICNYTGWLGMILVQAATLPTFLRYLFGYSTVLPPLSMVLLVWAGLACYFVRAYEQRDKLYMVSNGFGFIINTLILACIALPFL